MDQRRYGGRRYLFWICFGLSLYWNSVYFVLGGYLFPDKSMTFKALFALPHALTLAAYPIFCLSRRLRTAAFVTLLCIFLLDLAADAALVYIEGIATWGYAAFVLFTRVVVLWNVVRRFRAMQKRKGTLARRDTALRAFADHRADFLALRDALRFLPVRRIGKKLPDVPVMQEAAGWQVCSRDALPDDALAHLSDALTPLADVLYGVEMQATFTYFYVTPDDGTGRACVCYSLDGTEPTEQVCDRKSIEPRWFALQLE